VRLTSADLFGCAAAPTSLCSIVPLHHVRPDAVRQSLTRDAERPHATKKSQQENRRLGVQSLAAEPVRKFVALHSMPGTQ
jgi:hypothetical protein